MLLNAVCSADKSYMIQAPARTTALEQESVSVLSSGDEQDHDTVVLEGELFPFHLHFHRQLLNLFCAANLIRPF